MLALFFDDLHWADLSMVDLLAFVSDCFDSLRCWSLPYRPSDLLVTKHLFAPLQQVLSTRGVCRNIALKLLTPDHVERYLDL